MAPKFESCNFITYYCVILCKLSNLNFQLGYHLLGYSKDIYLARSRWCPGEHFIFNPNLTHLLGVKVMNVGQMYQMG